MTKTPPRVTKEEYERRVFIIQGWLVEGVQYGLILRNIMLQKWAQSERHAKRMVKKARENWTSDDENDLHQKRMLKVAELQQMIRNMDDRYKKTPSGIQAMAAIQKLIIQLEGLNPPKKVEVSGRDGRPIETSNTSKVLLYLPENGRNKSN